MRSTDGLNLAPSPCSSPSRPWLWPIAIACAALVVGAARAETLRAHDLNAYDASTATRYRGLVVSLARHAAQAPVEALRCPPIVRDAHPPTMPLAWPSLAPPRVPAGVPFGPRFVPPGQGGGDMSIFAGVVRRTAPVGVSGRRDDRERWAARRESTDDASGLVVVAFPPPLWIALIGLGVAAGARRRAFANSTASGRGLHQAFRKARRRDDDPLIP